VFKEGRKSPIFIGEPAFFFPTLSHLVYFNPRRFGGIIGGIFNFQNCDAPRMPLSDVFVRKLKPSSKPLRVFDGGGLYLEVAQSGGKLWRFKYRYMGKEKRLSLGVYPDVSIAQAREGREAARKLLAQDIDPGEHRKPGRLNGHPIVLKLSVANGSPSTRRIGRYRTPTKSLSGLRTMYSPG
jgi:hypothetical protein